MTTKWRLLCVAALLPVAGVVQAAQQGSALRSPASFDEALRTGGVELVSMMEPTPAEKAEAASITPAPAAAATASKPCGCNSCGDTCCDDTCCDDGCCDDGCDCGDMCKSCCGPTWTVRAGAAILTRSDPRRRNLVRGVGAGAPEGVVWSDLFDFDYAGGPDITLARWFDNGTGIEARYFGALQWEAGRTFNSPTNFGLNLSPNINGLGPASINVNYISRLNSTEINWRGGPTQTVAFLAGFRWVELHENLGINANLGANQATANWNTDNHLYGGQVGSIIQLLQNRGPFTADAWFKGGIYGNDADNQFNFDPTVGPHLNGHTSKGQVAFVGDIAFTGSYWFNKNVAFRSGYQLLWIDGVALASDQVNGTSSLTGQGVNTKGDVFYHGALVGLDFLW